MNTLLLLARRDLRLHASALVVPGLCVLLIIVAGLILGPATVPQGLMMARALSRIAFGLGALFALLNHFRETGYGTLDAQRLLPVSALQMATYRLVQALVPALLAWSLVVVGARVPVGLADLTLLAWLLLWLHAVPMALVARWGTQSLRFYVPGLFLVEFWALRHIPLAELKPGDEVMATLVQLSRTWLGPVDAFYALSPCLEPLMALLLLALVQALVKLALERGHA